MNAKRILSIALAVLMIAASVVSASAAQLTEQNPNGRTEVTARIDGSVPGNVTYIITIPDVVDFGTLAQPQTNTDDVKSVDYTVEATKIDGLDPATEQVSVYVKDQNATVDTDQEFYITNKANSAVSFTYDVYSARGAQMTAQTKVNGGNMSTNGYYLKGFTEQGQTLDGALSFNQRQLYGLNIADIAGEYSGYMVFFSAIESTN